MATYGKNDYPFSLIIPKATFIQTPFNGFLKGPETACFNCTFHDKKFKVSFDQLVFRKTDIECETDATINDYWLLFNLIDELVMLFEGKFIPLSKIEFYDENADILKGADTLLHGRLKMYSSAGFMQPAANYLLSFFDNISERLFQNWQALSAELEIIHSMFLYNVSDVEYPIDLKCAHLVEICEPIVEVIKAIKPGSLPAINGDAILRNCADSVIIGFGTDIFHLEYTSNKVAFLKILVKSRNRIMHIKRKQLTEKYLSGPESLIYCAKLACLYRNVLLQLLGIDYSKYRTSLLRYIDMLDNHENIVDNFIKQKLI